MILDARRDGGKNSARDKAVAFEFAHRERQHALRDIANRTANLIEAHGAPGEQFHDQHGPLVADPCRSLLLDLRDFPMPFFDQPATPAMPGRAPYKNEVVQRWTAAVAQSDGFVFVTPEYNYGTSAVLKNAIDWVYPEWNRKAAGFVSYGSAMGARAVQQLRESAIEVQLAPIRSSVHIPVATLWAHYTGGDVEAGLSELETPAGAMIHDLLWWTAALKTARAATR